MKDGVEVCLNKLGTFREAWRIAKCEVGVPKTDLKSMCVGMGGEGFESVMNAFVRQ